MPTRCSIVGCTANNKGTPYVTVFRFPLDPDRRKQWLTSIGVDNIKYNRKCYDVCSNHFEERFIVRGSTITTPEGLRKHIPFKKIRLTNDAYPTKFQILPSDNEQISNNNLSAKGGNNAKILKGQKQQDEEVLLEARYSNNIHSFEVMKGIISEKLSENRNWKCDVKENFILMYIVEMLPTPSIAVSFKILQDLRLEDIFVCNTEYSYRNLDWVLGRELICDKWSKFENLLSFFQDHKRRLSGDVNTKVNHICAQIKDLESTADVEPRQLQFLREQLTLMFKSKKEYSEDTIRFACSLYVTSPSAYTFLRQHNVIVLPHTSYCKRILKQEPAKKQQIDESLAMSLDESQSHEHISSEFNFDKSGGSSSNAEILKIGREENQRPLAKTPARRSVKSAALVGSPAGFGSESEVELQDDDIFRENSDILWEKIYEKTKALQDKESRNEVDNHPKINQIKKKKQPHIVTVEKSKIIRLSGPGEKQETLGTFTATENVEKSNQLMFKGVKDNDKIKITDIAMELLVRLQQENAECQVLDESQSVRTDESSSKHSKKRHATSNSSSESSSSSQTCSSNNGKRHKSSSCEQHLSEESRQVQILTDKPKDTVNSIEAQNKLN